MIKPFSLAWALLRASTMADMEYRANIVLKVLTDVLWYTATLSIFEVLFQHTRTIAGWDLPSTRVFMGLLFVVDAIWMIVFSENLDRFSEKVRRGDVDMYLTKPVNALYMLSIHRWTVAYFVNLFFVIGYLFWAMTQLPNGVPWDRLPLLFLSIPCSLAIMYFVRMLFAMSALIFVRAEAINYIWYQLYRLGTRPDAIYPPALRYVLLSVIPVAFIASVPARILLHDNPWPLLGIMGTMALAALYFSGAYWRFATKFYTSASS